MNATEARALTDARRKENDVQWYLRVKAIPAIQAAADAGYEKASCYTTGGGGSLSYDLLQHVEKALQDLGYKTVIKENTMFSAHYVMEVSW